MAVGLFTLLTVFGWRPPSSQIADLQAMDLKLSATDATLATHQVRTDSIGSATLRMVEGMAKDLCIHRTPTERVRLGLPCGVLLRDAVPDIRMERGP